MNLDSEKSHTASTFRSTTDRCSAHFMGKVTFFFSKLTMSFVYWPSCLLDVITSNLSTRDSRRLFLSKEMDDGCPKPCAHCERLQMDWKKREMAVNIGRNLEIFSCMVNAGTYGRSATVAQFCPFSHFSQFVPPDFNRSQCVPDTRHVGMSASLTALIQIQIHMYSKEIHAAVCAMDHLRIRLNMNLL